LRTTKSMYKNGHRQPGQPGEVRAALFNGALDH